MPVPGHPAELRYPGVALHGAPLWGFTYRLICDWLALGPRPPLLEQAASLKARYPMSLGDAWIAATAMQCNAVLLHKDPEFEPVAELQHEPLPYK